jgi:O-antigen/teichoic acid export membrane protein
VAPTVTRVWESEGPAAVGSLYTSTLRWLYTYSVIALGLLWLTAPDITRVWLGPEHDAIATLIRLWVISYGVNLAWSLGAAVARAIGKPWIEVMSLTACVLANFGLGLWAVPRYGTAGAIGALAASYAAGFVTFTILSRRSGIPFGPWIGRELLPRAAVASLAVFLCAALLAAAPLSRLLPPLGWAHGAIAALLFLAVFALFFLPLGDTQRLSRALWGMTAGAMAQRRARSSM